jgi:hypothetical protein
MLRTLPKKTSFLLLAVNAFCALVAASIFQKRMEAQSTIRGTPTFVGGIPIVDCTKPGPAYCVS